MQQLADGLPLGVLTPSELARVDGVVAQGLAEAATLAGPVASALEATVEVAEPMGAETYLYLRAGASELVARVKPTERYTVGQRVRVAPDLARAHLFDAETDAALV